VKGCNCKKGDEECRQACIHTTRYACFRCVIEDISQSSTQILTVGCMQKAVTAARMKATFEASSEQRNKIKADALISAIGDPAKANIANINQSIDTKRCTTRFRDSTEMYHCLIRFAGHYHRSRVKRYCSGYKSSFRHEGNQRLPSGH
jgi:hypothetical protein